MSGTQTCVDTSLNTCLRIPSHVQPATASLPGPALLARPIPPSRHSLDAGDGPKGPQEAEAGGDEEGQREAHAPALRRPPVAPLVGACAGEGYAHRVYA